MPFGLDFTAVNIFDINRRINILKIVPIVSQQIGVDVFGRGENYRVGEFYLFWICFFRQIMAWSAISLLISTISTLWKNWSIKSFSV